MASIYLLLVSTGKQNYHFGCRLIDTPPLSETYGCHLPEWRIEGSYCEFTDGAKAEICEKDELEETGSVTGNAHLNTRSVKRLQQYRVTNGQCACVMVFMIALSSLCN